MQPWKRIEPTIVEKVRHRTIVTKTFEMPDGMQSDFQTYDLEGRQYVAVVALTPDNQVLVARQFRAGPEKVMEELPGGGVEDGETLETAAIRELLEETSYAPERIEYLGFNHKDEKFNAVHHYFIAYKCQKTATEQHLDQDEHIQVDTVPIDTFLLNARSGLLTDTGAVLMAYDTLRAIQAGQKTE